MTTKRKNLDETEDLTPESPEPILELDPLEKIILESPPTEEKTEVKPKELSPVLKALSKPKVPKETTEFNKNELTQSPISDTHVAQEIQEAIKPKLQPKPKRIQPRNTLRFSAHK
jgi:hypothetical protein